MTADELQALGQRLGREIVDILARIHARADVDAIALARAGATDEEIIGFLRAHLESLRTLPDQLEQALIRSTGST